MSFRDVAAGLRDEADTDHDVQQALLERAAEQLTGEPVRADTPEKQKKVRRKGGSKGVPDALVMAPPSPLIGVSYPEPTPQDREDAATGPFVVVPVNNTFFQVRKGGPKGPVDATAVDERRAVVLCAQKNRAAA